MRGVGGFNPPRGATTGEWSFGAVVPPSCMEFLPAQAFAVLAERRMTHSPCLIRILMRSYSSSPTSRILRVPGLSCGILQSQGIGEQQES